MFDKFINMSHTNCFPPNMVKTYLQITKVISVRCFNVLPTRQQLRVCGLLKKIRALVIQLTDLSFQ